MHNAVAFITAMGSPKKYGWTMFIAMVMNRASRSVVMAVGEVTTVGTRKMWEWSANIHQCQHQVVIVLLKIHLDDA